jgi:hypothetical protein
MHIFKEAYKQVLSKKSNLKNLNTNIGVGLGEWQNYKDYLMRGRKDWSG